MGKFFIYDEFSPEDNAMLQALYSRSALSVAEHVDKVRSTGSGKFMEKFYVGYGHASIADCGSTTIFIENISILCDKAIQDWPLYSGQETSTRYIDMSKQEIIDPVKTQDSQAIIKKWMDFYVSGQKEMQEHLKSVFPREDGQKEAVYEKAIAARSFDVMRGFLPAGITTQLSWHTNLRQAHDKLCFLRHHPLNEVREAANTIHGMLKDKYKNSFGHDNTEEQEDYWEYAMSKYHYYLPQEEPEEFKYTVHMDNKDLSEYKELFAKRPPKTGLPHFLAEYGSMTFEFLMDFGSFRDIQRHRNGVCRMPLLTTKFKFNEWYLSQLPPKLREQADKLIAEQKEAIDKIDSTPELKQYLIALGFNVACKNTYALPATVYTLELRSGQAVHPSLRKIAVKMHEAVAKEFPMLKLNADLRPSVWDVTRGEHDITEKK